MASANDPTQPSKYRLMAKASARPHAKAWRSRPTPPERACRDCRRPCAGRPAAEIPRACTESTPKGFTAPGPGSSLRSRSDSSPSNPTACSAHRGGGSALCLPAAVVPRPAVMQGAIAQAYCRPGRAANRACRPEQLAAPRSLAPSCPVPAARRASLR